jgi:shikimate dehydrogenase
MNPISIDTKTALYGVIGDPVAHSLSPVMHNRAFAETGHPGVYLAFRVIDLPPAVAGIRALGLKGVSVTLPHKVAMMDQLDEIDPLAEKIGAVNTIVNRNGRLVGFNTDGRGAVDALADAIAVSGSRVALVGAGGAARAIGFTLAAEGAGVTVVNRSEARGKALARDLDADFQPLGRFGPDGFDILVNTTTVGMVPGTDATPIRPEDLCPDMVVMDIVYNPLETLLLESAGKIGCRTVDGVAMFVNQGAAQFELWTGKKAPVVAMREAVMAALMP